MATALAEPAAPAASSRLGPYTRRDFEALPDEPRQELIYGRFFVSPSPSLRHQTVIQVLYEELRQCAARSGGFCYFAPLDVHLGNHSAVQPDVFYVSPARREILKDAIEGAPDLVIEVLSPGSARRDREQKLGLYAESGVREYWIVDAQEFQINFLVNDDGRFVVALASDGRYVSKALPELELDLEAFWQAVAARLPG